MYGLLELAEQLRNAEGKREEGRGKSSDTQQSKIENRKSKIENWLRMAASLFATTQRPFLEFRADNAFIHATDRSLFFDIPMWKAYIDGLARARFNVLDLHGGYDLRTTGFPNLYPLLVHVPEYPDVGDSVQQSRNLADFRAIVSYAQSRGVRVAFMNYSVGGLAPRGDRLADYTARAVATFLREVPELSMLGFRVGETGQKADFFQAAYLRGVQLSGRKDVRLYTRSWQTTQEQLEAIGQATGGNFDIEIKYNGEQFGLPYQAIGKGGGSYSYQGYIHPNAPYRIIWQVRTNGTHRFWAWGDAEWIRRAVQSFRFGRARGFTLEPYIAYFPYLAAAYYRSPQDQGVYKYIWEKYWMWHFLWGRLAYNPQLPESTLIAAFKQRFGLAGRAIYEAMKVSGPIVPLVCAYRYQGPDQRDWAPETETGCFANKGRDWNGKDLTAEVAQIGVSAPDRFSALTFGQHQPMDPSAFAQIRDYVNSKVKAEPEGRVGPAWIAAVLTQAAKAARSAVARVEAPSGHASEEWRLLKTDLLAACALGEFYSARILGTVHLTYAVQTGSAADYERALNYLALSRGCWKVLAETTDAVYAPLDNPLRHQPGFQWAQPLPALEQLDATAPRLWAGVKPDPSAPPLQITPADEGADVGISLVSLSHTLHSGSVTITCRIRVQSGVKQITLWRRDLPSESVWERQPMSGSAETYSAKLAFPPTGMLYFVEVEDEAGHARNLPNVLQECPYRVIYPDE